MLKSNNPRYDVINKFAPYTPGNPRYINNVINMIDGIGNNTQNILV
ncbi:MAG: hypothetical protein WC679_00365 [Bacteroidales bacterium]